MTSNLEKEKIEYVNLHIHSEYSSLDGFARFEDVVDSKGNVIMQGIVSRLKEIGHKSCTITDHASLSATYPAYLSFKEAGIKYLPGIEFYMVGDRTRGKQMNNHLICIARNQEGWKNILKLNYEGFRTGSTSIYDRVVPRIDMELLEQYNEGLLVASACLAGVPAQLVKNEEYDQAAAFAKKMQSMFYDKKLGQDCYFLEVQCVDYYRMLSDTSKTTVFDKQWIERQARDQKIVNDRIIDLAERTNIPLVCTTDSHYVGKEDRDAHLLLLAIQSKTSIKSSTDGRGGRLAFEATAMLSTEELIEAFTETESGFNGYSKDQVEGWIKNTTLADSLIESPDYLKPEGYKLPEFPVNESTDFSKFCEWKSKLEKDEISNILFEAEDSLKTKIIY